MLKLADTKIENILPVFAEKGVDIAFIVPTKTGMSKYFFDATTMFRQFLLRNGIHDYTSQRQGKDSKVFFKAYFVYEHKLVETTTSLYRPDTKNGDPRLWFSCLGKFCLPFNLLGVVTDGAALYVFNLSDAKIASTATLYGEPARGVGTNNVFRQFCIRRTTSQTA